VSESVQRDLPISFSSFVVSLASSAMLHLGLAPHPESGRKEVHLPLARNSIDLLGVLKEKTEGNLEDDESKLLDSVLYDLRTRFVELAGEPSDEE
jgi:hypothetical protein